MRLQVYELESGRLVNTFGDSKARYTDVSILPGMFFSRARLVLHLTQQLQTAILLLPSTTVDL